LLVGVVDYGMGNIGSIVNMLHRLGVKAATDAAAIEHADKLILPGVGAFDSGLRNLAEKDLTPSLRSRVIGAGVPVLGICLGMQLMTKGSEEGEMVGLGWIDARTIKLRFDKENASLRIPHMGWNTITAARSCPLLEGLGEESRFYFVHSYHVQPGDDNTVAARTFYGRDLVSVVHRGNIFGVQFHPEKSHRFGMAVLKNFVEL